MVCNANVIYRDFIMKTETFWKWTLGLALVVNPLAGRCDQPSVNSAPAVVSGTNQPADVEAAVSPEAAEQALENAPGKVVSTPAASSQVPNLSAAAAEVAKLAQAGTDESVMASYVSSSTHTFNLNSDAIIYLNDIGVSSAVISAMIQHDQGMKESSASYAAPPAPANGSFQAAGTAESQSPPVVENAAPPQQVNGASTYFYDSLAPYGSWINVEGYGPCWQPTVVVVNHGWSPYCDRGRWANTDLGWCWVSDYSWGWAPFHYGRWFRHNRWGWCWAPDTVWGPAWVSWRYGDEFCGWAPLPPIACFVPGKGRFTRLGLDVGFSFPFGLTADVFTCVRFEDFTDRRWQEHRMPRDEVRRMFSHTVVGNSVVVRNKVIINEGVPVRRIADATHREIPRMHIRDAADPVSTHRDHVGRDRGSVAVYRPQLPVPTHQGSFVGQGIQPQPHPGAIPGSGRTPDPVRNGAPRHSTGAVNSGLSHTETTPALRNTPFLPPHNEARAETPAPAKTQSQPLQSPRALRQEAPKYGQRDQKVSPQPGTVVRSQPSTPPYQWAPSAEPREQQHLWAPAQHSVQPVHAAPAAPAPARVEPTPQPQRSSSARAASQGSGQSNNHRHDH
jgi:hypothetical protein